MNRRAIVMAGALLAAVFVTHCGNDGADPVGDLCTEAGVASALQAASSGDTVVLGACRIEVSALTIPAGVTLSGGDRDLTILAGNGNHLLTLTAGTPPSRLTNVTLESSGGVAVYAQGSGEVALQAVSVISTRGVGLAVMGLQSLELTDVSIRGPVTTESANTLAPDVGPDETATVGLVILDVADAALSDVTVSGFAQFGTLLVNSASTWIGGGSSDNLGFGLLIDGGAATLTDVELCGSLQGLRLPPTMNAAFIDGASITTSGLLVCESEGLGLVHDRVTAQHADIVVRDNRDVGLWVQLCDGFELSGVASSIVGNRLGGVVALDSSNVTLADATISETEAFTRLIDTGNGFTPTEVGDGVQIVGSSQSVTLRDLTLSDNARVGVLLDLAGRTFDGVSLTNVAVSGSGDELGVVAQGAELPDGWDDSVQRGSVTSTNDAAFDGELGVLDLIGPNDIPDPEELTGDGVDGLIGPND